MFYRRIRIFNPNVGEEDGCTQVKSDEIGYLISIKSVTKKNYHNLVARIQASFYNMDSEKKMLLCTGKSTLPRLDGIFCKQNWSFILERFCSRDLSNYYNDNDEEYHFNLRKLPFDKSLGVQKLRLSVTIQLYLHETMQKGCEEPSLHSWRRKKGKVYFGPDRFHKDIFFLKYTQYFKNEL